MPRKPANCYIIAGPNGAGKTTFATEFLPLYANCRNFGHLLDNAPDTPRLIFKDEVGRTSANDAALYQRLRKEFAP